MPSKLVAQLTASELDFDNLFMWQIVEAAIKLRNAPSKLVTRLTASELDFMWQIVEAVRSCHARDASGGCDHDGRDPWPLVARPHRGRLGAMLTPDDLDAIKARWDGSDDGWAVREDIGLLIDEVRRLWRLDGTEALREIRRLLDELEI